MHLEYSCDAGSLRIDFADGWFHLPNGSGDGSFNVQILPGHDSVVENEYRFITAFAVSTSATVSGYDCANQPIFELPAGRYGAYSRDGDMLLVRWDDRIE